MVSMVYVSWVPPSPLLFCCDGRAIDARQERRCISSYECHREVKCGVACIRRLRLDCGNLVWNDGRVVGLVARYRR